MVHVTPQMLQELYIKNLKLTKQAIKDSVNSDQFIIQTTNSLTELNRTTNTMMRRLREWYELYAPEPSHYLKDHEKFTELILTKSKQELLQEFSIKQTMGADLSKEDLAPMLLLANQIQASFKLKKELEAYLEITMKAYMPNVTAITGALIGAKLLEVAGSLKRMISFAASTIQLLGAEKALFRHLRSKALPPKFGVIFAHQLIQKAHKKEQGKVARGLADKICIAAKIDFFKGEFIGDQLRKDLEKRFQ